METPLPQTWRSEAFAEDLAGDDIGPADAPADPWAPHTGWLCALPLAASALGGVAAFLHRVPKDRALRGPG